MKKKKWMKIEHSVNGKNEVRLASPFDSKIDYRIELFDKRKNKVKKYDDLEMTGAKNTARIILEVDGDKGEHQEDSPEGIEYRLTDDAWKSEKELKKAEQEAYVKLFKDKFKDKEFEKANELKDNDTSCLIRDEAACGISLHLRKKADSSSQTITISGEDIEIELDCYITKKVNLRDEIELRPEEKKSWWTPRKITICVVILVVIFVLTIVFWKKIWRWIKGKNKQEKQEKEQLDIF